MYPLQLPNKRWVKYQTEPHTRADTVSRFGGGGTAGGVSTLNIGENGALLARTVCRLHTYM